MARKTKQPKEEVLQDPPTSIHPYEVLGVGKTATADQIRSAYRRAALKHHPDKASPKHKEEAHTQFQEIAFAYAILSDERRRKRYDNTGNTSESLALEDDDFSWTDFFREQTAAMVDGAMIDKIKNEYQGSPEEKEDILRVYDEYEGDMDALYEEILCSNVLDDDERFRNIIDQAIKDGAVGSYKAYAKESKPRRKKRKQNAEREAEEAMQLAEELGVKDKLFGTAHSKTSKKGGGDDALRALIQQRQRGRAGNFLDNLEAKYGGGKKSKHKDNDEPPEEAFQKKAKKQKVQR
jgi:DnaJ homolog subfamily C member 9